MDLTMNDYSKCNWYDPKHPELGVRTFSTYKNRNPKVTTEELIKAGIKPVIYEIPEYNADLFKHIPSGKLNDVNSMVERDGFLVQTFTVVPLDIKLAKSNLIKKVKKNRQKKESQKITISGVDNIEALIPDQTTRNLFLEFVNYNANVNYKNNDGTFITLTTDQVRSVLKQLTDFVQTCFNREKELNDKIVNAQSIDELKTIDLSF